MGRTNYKHMMFQGSDNVADEEHMKTIRNVIKRELIQKSELNVNVFIHVLMVHVCVHQLTTFSGCPTCGSTSQGQVHIYLF